MGIVLMIAHVTNNDLKIVALAGFMSTVSVFLFMGSIGHYLDATNRLSAAYAALTVKIIVVTLAYCVCAFLAEEPFYSSKFIYFLPCASAVASLCFNALNQSVEKDWVVVLADKDSAWLTTTNSTMSQIDLACASFAPALTGYLFETCSLAGVAVILLLTNGLSAFGLMVLLRYLYGSFPALAVRELQESKIAQSQSEINDDVDSLATDSPPPSNCSCLIRMLGLEEFANCGCAMVMVAYAFLYMTVLSFGSLMTVYLRFAGMPDSTFRGLSALSGFLGACSFPFVNAYMGLYSTGQLSLTYQCFLVCVAAVSFFVCSDQLEVAYIISIAVLLSRVGLWMFDLAVRQISQETIPEHVRGKVNGQWRAMTAGFEMMSYLIAFSLPGIETWRH
eukprot:gene26125-31546_t